jgi:hypothetical protein
LFPLPSGEFDEVPHYGWLVKLPVEELERRYPGRIPSRSRGTLPVLIQAPDDLPGLDHAREETLLTIPEIRRAAMQMEELCFHQLGIQRSFREALEHWPPQAPSPTMQQAFDNIIGFPMPRAFADSLTAAQATEWPVPLSAKWQIALDYLRDGFNLSKQEYRGILGYNEEILYWIDRRKLSLEE